MEPAQSRAAARSWRSRAKRKSQSLRVLSDGQMEAIHDASLDVLARVGCLVPVPEARDLLAGAGARVDGQRVYIGPETVEWALDNLRPVTLYNRVGAPLLPLAEGHVTFGALVDNLYVQDAYRSGMRPFLRSDLAWSARLLDALPDIDWVACSGQMHDVPPEVQTQLAFAGALPYTTKPILVYPYQRAGLLDILEAASVVAGGRDALRARPFVFCASVPSAPLVQADYNLEILLACAEHEVPVVYHPHPAMGANSPCNIPGTLVLANADWLAGLTMHQLKRPGAPFCSAGFTELLMDMRTTLWSYCAPELLPAYAAVADLAHWYGMPAWGIEMLADTPRLNAQAGAELALTCAWAFLCNIELVHNAGLLGACKVCSAESVVLADEQIAYARAAFAKPLLQFSAGALSAVTDLIGSVGPGGDYLMQPDTLAGFRSFWYPRVFDRSNFDAEADETGDTLQDRLNARARDLIEVHMPLPLPEDVRAELARMERVWTEQAGE
jgi:trimethylamine---corrinoid protein Co-methyltransferase